MDSNNLKIKLQKLAKKHRVTGFSIQLIDDFELGNSIVYGLTQKKIGTLVDNKTLFQAASLSKTIAALITLRFIEEGKIKLDAVHNFLNHSAGIPASDFRGYEIGDDLPMLQQIISGKPPANSKPLSQKYPLGKYHYSGGGYMLVQKMIQNISKKPFATLAKEYIFNPLHMKQSTFKIIYPDTQTNIAYGNAPKEQLKGPWKIHPESAAAGLWTTPTEMAKVVVEIMRALDGRKSSFSRWLASTMTHSEIKGVGLGTFVHTLKSGVEFGHDGANVGYRARYLALPNGKGLVIMVNNDNGFRFIDEAVSLIGKECGWGRFKIKP
jgi:CubicO group peptidase (beta-lactamase class C family)